MLLAIEINGKAQALMRKSKIGDEVTPIFGPVQVCESAAPNSPQSPKAPKPPRSMGGCFAMIAVGSHFSVGDFFTRATAREAVGFDFAPAAQNANTRKQKR
jgi:hypothetical protein